jgi:hypothetical protein
MSKASDAQWQHLWNYNSLLGKLFLLCSIFGKIEAQHSNVDLARKISASLQLTPALETSSEHSSQVRGGQATFDPSSSTPVYISLEDRLFFDKEKRDINSSKALCTPKPSRMPSLDKASEGLTGSTHALQVCMNYWRCSGSSMISWDLEMFGSVVTNGRRHALCCP